MQGNERTELTCARLRCGLSVAVTARTTGVSEIRLANFEDFFHPLTPEETETLREFYGDFLAAVEESATFPNVFDAGPVQYFVGRYRYRREQRERQQKFLDDNDINAFGRPDPVKIAKHRAEIEQETMRRTLEKAKSVMANAKAEIDFLAK